MDFFFVSSLPVVPDDFYLTADGHVGVPELGECDGDLAVGHGGLVSLHKGVRGSFFLSYMRMNEETITFLLIAVFSHFLGLAFPNALLILR